MSTVFKTHSGIMFNLQDFNIKDINIIDISHSLSNTCRYNGHCHRFYSVAEHCILGSYLIEPELALFFLLHDASEAYMGDVITPLKKMFPLYQEKEDELLGLIFQKFIPVPYTDEIGKKIKEVDKEMLDLELKFLFENINNITFGLTPKSDIRDLFLKRYLFLMEKLYK